MTNPRLKRLETSAMPRSTARDDPFHGAVEFDVEQHLGGDLESEPRHVLADVPLFTLAPAIEKPRWRSRTIMSANSASLSRLQECWRNQSVLMPPQVASAGQQAVPKTRATWRQKKRYLMYSACRVTRTCSTWCGSSRSTAFVTPRRRQNNVAVLASAAGEETEEIAPERRQVTEQQMARGSEWHR